ncbi:MAG: sugar phosphate isomerase/epimerase [Thermoguttaceae bacterium]|nr:sugar phosphate isomerase/epimerase [Thermoguttaceae bacterium]
MRTIWENEMDRRSFLKSGLGAAAFGAFSATSSAVRDALFAAEPVKKVPIALQVYSVREYASKDLRGTLKRIADIGYKGVEFAGYYGNEAKDIRKWLDEAGLKAISTHLGVPQLLEGTFEQTVEFEKTLGNRRLIVAGGLSASCATDAGNQMTAYLFNEIAAKARKVDMQIGFHSHFNDFTDINGTNAWDLFFSRTADDIIAQVDVGNTMHGGADPYAEVAKFPGRGQLLHVKAENEEGKHGACVGGPGDIVDWDRMFDIAENIGGVEWYIVEQEDSRDGQDIFDACAECFENLKKMGKV